MRKLAFALARLQGGDAPLPAVLARPTAQSFSRALRGTGSFLLFGVLPLVLGVGLAYKLYDLGVFGFDFRGTLWQPGRDVLEGRVPYPLPRADLVDGGNPSVYPPAVFLVTLPLALLPFGVAVGLWVAALALGVVGALAALGVRDWRCYTLALGSAPVVLGATFGNFTILLVLGAAVVWRWRNRLWLVALLVGALVAAKLFLWPLLVWLAVTRRWRAAAAALAGSAAVVVTAWAVIGFDGLADYPRLLQAVSDVYGQHSWSLVSGGVALGLSASLAAKVALGAGLAILTWGVLIARRADGDRRSFSAALVAALVASPIVWPFNFAFLLVPLALLQPKLGKFWLAVPALWAANSLPVPHAYPGRRCCRPLDDIPAAVWSTIHARPPGAQIAAYMSVALIVLALSALTVRKPVAGERSI